MIMSNKMYDILKFLALRVLPAIGALYFGASQIWHLPYGEQVVGTIALVTACIGQILGLSSDKYNK